jgi:hypothetical protein
MASFTAAPPGATVPTPASQTPAHGTRTPTIAPMPRGRHRTLDGRLQLGLHIAADGGIHLIRQWQRHRVGRRARGQRDRHRERAGYRRKTPRSTKSPHPHPWSVLSA